MQEDTIPEGWEQYSARCYRRIRPAKEGTVKVIKSYRTGKWTVLVDKGHGKTDTLLASGPFTHLRAAWAGLDKIGAL